MIACMVFNFSISSTPTQPFFSSFNQYSEQCSCQGTGCFPTLVERMNSGERVKNPVAIII